MYSRNCYAYCYSTEKAGEEEEQEKKINTQKEKKIKINRKSKIRRKKKTSFNSGKCQYYIAKRPEISETITRQQNLNDKGKKHCPTNIFLSSISLPCMARSLQPPVLRFEWKNIYYQIAASVKIKDKIAELGSNSTLIVSGLRHRVLGTLLSSLVWESYYCSISPYGEFMRVSSKLRQVFPV